MTHWRTYAFIISLFPVLFLHGQDNGKDTKSTSFGDILHQTYVRIGYDAGKKIYARLNGGNMDVAYLNLGYKNHILEFFVGKEAMPYVHQNYMFQTAGSYFKLGYAYNFYDNWGNMHNEITLGLRYGSANFAYDLQGFSFSAPAEIMSSYEWTGHHAYPGLYASWIEIGASVKAEIFHGLYLDLFVSGKRMAKGIPPQNFGLLYVPGFFKTNVSGFGFGLGYGVSYRFGF